MRKSLYHTTQPFHWPVQKHRVFFKNVSVDIPHILIRMCMKIRVMAPHQQLWFTDSIHLDECESCSAGIDGH